MRTKTHTHHPPHTPTHTHTHTHTHTLPCEQRKGEAVLTGRKRKYIDFLDILLEAKVRYWWCHFRSYDIIWCHVTSLFVPGFRRYWYDWFRDPSWSGHICVRGSWHYSCRYVCTVVNYDLWPLVAMVCTVVWCVNYDLWPLVAMAWTLYNLALHPEHQIKCRQEVDTIFEETDEIGL